MNDDAEHDDQADEGKPGAAQGDAAGSAGTGQQSSTHETSRPGTQQHSAAGEQQVEAVWNTPMWGRKIGHREKVELTDLIRSVAADGRLTLYGADGEELAVTRPPRPSRAQARAARPRAPRPAPSKIVRK